MPSARGPGEASELARSCGPCAFESHIPCLVGLHPNSADLRPVPRGLPRPLLGAVRAFRPRSDASLPSITGKGAAVGRRVWVAKLLDPAASAEERPASIPALGPGDSRSIPL